MMARNRTGGSIGEPEELDSMEELDADAAVELDEEGEFEAEDDEAPAVRASDRSSGRVAEAKTVASQQVLREQLAREVEEFLARGGRINVVEPRVVAGGGPGSGSWGSDGQVSE